MAKPDPWHFTRKDAAQRTFMLIEKRLATALLLFGPRRMGKTEFLRQDVGPLAEKAGHRVVYVSFWQAPLAPAATMIAALDHALRHGSLADQLRNQAQGLRPKVRLGGAVAGAEAHAEIDLAGIPEAPSGDVLLAMDALLGKLARKGKPTLLLLDEVQELALDPKNRPFVAALRTSLDTRRDGLAAIFTGSSREGLAAMFSDRAAPFFHFATSIDLEPLGPPFVTHLLDAFEKATGERLDAKAALAAFESLDRSPYFFRMLLEQLLPLPKRDIPAALLRLREGLAAALGYDRLWLSLTSVQRALTATLARGAAAPFGEANRAEIGRLVGAATPTIAQTQSALRRLTRLGILDKAGPRGGWTFDDPEFARWVAGLPDEAF